MKPRKTKKVIARETAVWAEKIAQAAREAGMAGAAKEMTAVLKKTRERSNKGNYEKV